MEAGGTGARLQGVELGQQDAEQQTVQAGQSVL